MRRLPVPVSAKPINVTVTAQTTGGNTARMYFPGKTEKITSRRLATMHVPIIIPYATVPSMPSAIIWRIPISKILW